jgi:carboxyl-terminal processing protease
VVGDHRKPDDQWDFMIDKDKKIGYVRISSFIQNTADELRKALQQLKEENVKGLILDLRDNPGGLLSSAVEISDMFLPEGKIVSTEGRNTIPKSYMAQKDSPFEEMPLVVLINQNSASASEIVSAALQDNNRATVIGQRSYGKGSVQNILELDDGNSVLKLTVATYRRPNKADIHRYRDSRPTDPWGVSPSPGQEIKLSPIEYARWFVGRRDRDLKAAAKGHGNKQVAAKAETGKAKEKSKEQEKAKDTGNPKGQLKVRSPHAESGPFVDKVLDRALEVIRSKLAGDQKAKAA